MKSPYMKAFAGAAMAGLGSLAVALSDGAVSPLEWVLVAIAAVGGLGLVYKVPNAGYVLADEQLETGDPADSK